MELENQLARIHPRNTIHLQVCDILFLVTERILGFDRLGIPQQRRHPVDDQSMAPLLMPGRGRF